MAFQLQVAAANVPPGTCYPVTWAQALKAIASNLIITGLGALNSFNYGPTTPAADLQDRPWIKTDSQYNLIGLFTFGSNGWQTNNPFPPGVSFDYWGPPGSIVAPYYLCNGQTVTGPIGGSFTTPNLPGLVTVGSGTNSTTGTSFVYGTTGGEEKHTQTLNEIVSHGHFIPTNTTAGGSGGIVTSSIACGSNAPTGNNGGSIPVGGGAPFNVMQPFAVCYKIVFWP